jgi:hypothetical protein
VGFSRYSCPIDVTLVMGNVYSPYGKALRIGSDHPPPPPRKTDRCDGRSEQHSTEHQ